MVDIMLTIDYICSMLEILKSAAFDAWFAALRDRQAQARITSPHPTAVARQPGRREAGGGISELRIDHGPGYRVYYCQHGAALILLLCGGDKRSQDADIKRASAIAKDWR